jgi:ABC-type dipeptide/oligopeptide/nickel transport system permease subunit
VAGVATGVASAWYGGWIDSVLSRGTELLFAFPGLQICIRHVLPNVAPVVLAQSTINFGYALIDLAGLSFLGLGVPSQVARRDL